MTERLHLLHAFKWSMASELATKAISPLVFVILARLLTPPDYGVMTAALMIIGFTQIFWEAGMSKALIQRQTDIEEAANAAFWINIGIGLLMAGILFLVAGPVARTFFKDERVTNVLRVMTLQVFFGAVSAVQTALLQKEMGFKKLFWVRFATVSLPGLASIPLAWNGMGYWALVAGTLVGQLAQVIMLWHMSSWRPKWSFNTAVGREMARFGAWVGVSGLLSWFYVWADSLIVGMYLGNHELGLYRTGNQFSIMIFAIIFGPITPVLYSHLTKMNQDKERLGRAIERVIKVITLTAIPVAFIVFSLAKPIEIILFSEKWQGIGFVIGVMGLMHGFSWVVGMNGEVYRAMGKPSYDTVVTATALTIYLAAYLLSIQHGFEVFIWTRLGLALAALILHMFVLRRLLSISLKPITQYLAMITLLTAVIVKTIQLLLTPPYLAGAWLQLMLGGALNLITLGAAIYLFERNGILKEISVLFRERVK